MLINNLLNILDKNKKLDFMVWKNKTYNYKKLINLVAVTQKELMLNGVLDGDVILLQADFSPKSVATLIALLKLNCIVGLFSSKNLILKTKYTELSQAKFNIYIDKDDNLHIDTYNNVCKHELLCALKNSNSAGLILFSSGSTGSPKASIHNFDKLFSTFLKPKKQIRIIAFLLFDHIGGLNTLFYALFNGGCLITLMERTPTEVVGAIVKHEAEALTTTPTFLNLMLLTDISKYNLQALRYINYSTEVMPEITLKKLKNMFPNVRLSQAYGSSETGVLSVSSKSSDSLYMKINDSNVQCRIVDNLLEIKSETSMLGYLNAESPFTRDGWYKTGDMVVVEGEFIRIIGRKSELINVGGEKVFPAEIENVLQKIKGVEDVSVYGEKNYLLGQIVTARIKTNSNENINRLKTRVNLFCRKYLPSYKIPQKITYTQNILHSERFKKIHSYEEKAQ